MSPPTRLDEDEIQRRLASLGAWTLTDGKLRRELRFRDFVEAFGFMTRVALLAETRNHHPEWSNVYATVVIELQTHDVGGLSESDFELAEAIDRELAHTTIGA